jgi:hypothetical protein
MEILFQICTVRGGLTWFLVWDLQELAVQYAVRLLSPPGVAEHRGGNAFLAHGPMLHAALTGMSTVDAINVLSLFGMVCTSPFSIFNWQFSKKDTLLISFSYNSLPS